MNRFGNNFRITIYGESHSVGLGLVLDGIPKGIDLDIWDFSEDLKRRQAGALGSTKRVEEDVPNITSGVVNGKTTGAPINIFFKNGNTNGKVYGDFRNHPRPGHGDFAISKKFENYNDLRGGGASSGRLTLLLVAAGVVAKKIIREHLKKDINVEAEITKLGNIEKNGNVEKSNNIEKSSNLEKSSSMEKNSDIEKNIDEKVQNNFLKRDDVIKLLIETEREGDSLGGIISCVATGVDVGVGEPFFDSLESIIAHLAFSIPGVKGIEFGAGFQGVSLKGSEFNDKIINREGKSLTNNSGGISAGVSNGNPITFRVAVKPTSSIFKKQESFNFKEDKISELQIVGRHDVAFIVRTSVIVESIVYISLVELLLS